MIVGERLSVPLPEDVCVRDAVSDGLRDPERVTLDVWLWDSVALCDAVPVWEAVLVPDWVIDGLIVCENVVTGNVTSTVAEPNCAREAGTALAWH